MNHILLTAVVLTTQNFDSICETIGYLAAQSVCNQMESLVLAPQKSGLDAAQLISSTRCAEKFGALCVVDFPETWTVGAANVAERYAVVFANIEYSMSLTMRCESFAKRFVARAAASR